MKKPLLLTLILIAALIQTTSAQDTTWYNKNWEITTADRAAYYRTKVKTDSGWHVTDCYRSGLIQMTGTYSDDSLKIQQHEFVWYHENGRPSRRCTFKDNKPDGPETHYYPNGKIQITGNNKDGESQGEWLGYYPSGKLSAKATYDKDKQTSGSYFLEDGSRNKSVDAFSRESEYPGGPSQFLRFLNKNVKYPEDAIKRKIKGTVVVQFKISKEGQVLDIKVIGHVDPSLDAEAVRVIQQMRDWRPALMGGLPVESYKKQPIVFNLE